MLLCLWDGSVSYCWRNEECGSAVMDGDTVKTTQAVVRYRKYRVGFFSSMDYVIILSSALYFKFMFLLQDLVS